MRRRRRRRIRYYIRPNHPYHLLYITINHTLREHRKKKKKKKEENDMDIYL
jgi:hypothetical protein